MPPTPESFEGQTEAPKATNVFTNRNPNGPIDAQAAPGNGSLPPGANVFRVVKPKAAKTTAAFLKSIGD